MSPEGYSRKAFEENEKQIDATRKLAKLSPFGGRPANMAGKEIDPGEIVSAKFNYVAGKQKREELLNQAHTEALQLDNSYSLNESRGENSLRVGDFSRIVIESTSGNKYVIQKNPDGEGFLIANFNKGSIQVVSKEQIENAQITKGEQLFFGDGANTTPITTITAWK